MQIVLTEIHSIELSNKNWNKQNNSTDQQIFGLNVYEKTLEGCNVSCYNNQTISDKKKSIDSK